MKKFTTCNTSDKKKRHILRMLPVLTVAGALSIALTGCGTSSEDEVQRYSWPLATASPEDTVTQLFAEKFAEEVSDLSNGKMAKVLPQSIDSYSYDSDTIYYFQYEPTGERPLSTDSGSLSVLDLTTGQSKVLATVTTLNEGIHYISTANGVYYRPDGTDGLCFWNKHTGTSEKINSGAIVTDAYSQNGYVIAHFAETPQNPYRLMVFAPSGKTMKQVCSTADVSDKAVINENGLLVYRLSGTNQLVVTQL